MLVEAYEEFRELLKLKDLPRPQDFRLSMIQFLDGQQCERHPLGFAKLTLAKGFHSEGSSLQVHLWTTKGVVDMPHSHSNYLESYVVVGSIALKKWNFNEDEDGQNTLFHIHHVGDGSREYLLAKRGEVQLHESFLVSSGQSYGIETDELHTTALRSDQACTIVARLGSKGKISKCVDPDRSLINGRYMSRNLDPDERFLVEKMIE